MPGTGLRFLVVEDHAFQRAVLVQLLQSLGAQAVHVASDGAAALLVLRDPALPVDVVITDIWMPGMDGMEFVRNLSESGFRVAVVLASAVPADVLAAIANMARAYRVNLLGVIGKPATAAKLTPLLELHRSGAAAGAPDAASRFALDEIAEAWSAGEFEPWYEPELDVRSGDLRGLHASARWRRPTGQVLEPAEFLPSMRARGLLEDFAALLLHRAAARCRDWRLQRVGATVSVPLLFDSWSDVTLATRIAEVARDEGLDPAAMVLCVRHAALREMTPALLENLARLRVAGFKLALDQLDVDDVDIDELARLPFTHMRIGGDLVGESDRDEEGRARLSAALHLAKALQVQPMAEGVRSRAQWTLLREAGCWCAQGPLLGPAIEPHSVLDWLRRG
jgi:EAL domain-containing protein (putative c-di-GMP-specific phosphodiesterase class I)